MKRFKLKKLETHNKELEETLGYTAEGIQFSNGVCVLCWLSSVHSTVAIYESIEIIEFIHGHQGKTVVEWVDNELTGCDHDFWFSQRKQSYLCIKCNRTFKNVVDKKNYTATSKPVRCEQCNSIIVETYSLGNTSSIGKRRFFCSEGCYYFGIKGLKYYDARN